MAEAVGEFLGKYLTPELACFVVSMLPILELRAGMIVASLLGVPYFTGLILCVIGNIIPIPFIVFLIRYVLNFLQKHGPIKKFALWVEEHGTKKGKEFEEKYPTRIFLGLLLFVAIPIPGTGAWTGSLISVLLGVSPKRSIPALLLGVVCCAGIMSFISYGIPALIGLFA